MQIVIPLVMTVSLFGALGGEPMTLLKDSGWIFGKIAAGTPTWIQNAGLCLGALAGAAVDRLLVRHEQPEDGLAGHRQPDHGRSPRSPISTRWRLSRRSRPLPLPAEAHRLGLLNMWVAIPLDIVAALLIMKLAAFGTMKEKHRQAVRHLPRQTHLVDDGAVHRHLRLLHRLLDGAAAVHHGDLRHQPRSRRRRRDAAHAEEPQRASAFTYAWMGPFIGAAVRPSAAGSPTKVGGSIVTQIISPVMVVASVAVAT